MKQHTYRNWWRQFRSAAVKKCAMTCAMACAVSLLSGCTSEHTAKETMSAVEQTVSIVTENLPEESPVIQGLDQLTIDGPDYDVLKDLPVPETEPA